MADGVTIFGIDAQTILQALQKHCPDRNIDIVSDYKTPRNSEDVYILRDSDSAKDVEIGRLSKLVAARDTQMKEMEVNTKIAVQSIQTFHQQQQALYEEFKALREKYDDQKDTLHSTLWTHCIAHNPDLRYIPKEQGPNFTDTETQVGDYSVGDALGEGQFATVYTCMSKHVPNKVFAIKVLKKDRITNFKSLRRVSNEIETLKKLNSDYMIKIVDCMHTAKHLYIVTEMGGQDMFEFFDEHPDGVDESWAQDIICGILEAIYHCHKNFICHRDLKPENILLQFDAEKQKCIDIKLCDFGLSTKFEKGMRLTDFCGSPGFFAPEMITAGVYDGEKVDVWSVGCVLLELLLGHETFCDVWMSAYEIEIMRDKEVFLEHVVGSVGHLPQVLTFSPELCDFVRQVLTIDGKERPTSAELCQHEWVKNKFSKHLVTGHDHPHNTPMTHHDRSNSSASQRMRLAARERECQVEEAKRIRETPSVVTARKIMEKGNRLARLASSQYEETQSDGDSEAI